MNHTKDERSACCLNTSYGGIARPVLLSIIHAIPGLPDGLELDFIRSVKLLII